MDTIGLLEKLREPFPKEYIGKLPKPTKRQTQVVKEDFKQGVRCSLCGGWHHPEVVHLDYVGHAPITARLLDIDPYWNWEPLAYDENGLPALDGDLLWIKLTVCGVTRIGCGDSQNKDGGEAMKERIGDAIRNAAMRFGAALDLWHKYGDLPAGGSTISLNDEVKERIKTGLEKGAKTPQIARKLQVPEVIIQAYIDELKLNES